MSIDSPDSALHGQDPEVQLLASLAGDLHERSALDVGADGGAVAAHLLAADYGPLTLIEPNPSSVERLRGRFGPGDDVTILELAAGAADGRAALRPAYDSEGRPLSEFASTLARPDTGTVRWGDGVEVQQRSLRSLILADAIPDTVGLLKVDTEGRDRDVVAGAAGLRCEIVMVEFWSDLPESLGPCPFTLEELEPLVRELGPSRFIWFRHAALHTTLTWDTADPARGEWGNLVFLGDHLVEAAESAVEGIRRDLERHLEALAWALHEAAAERLALVQERNREYRRLEQELAQARAGRS
jgi:FkbM family methyltransferase